MSVEFIHIYKCGSSDFVNLFFYARSLEYIQLYIFAGRVNGPEDWFLYTSLEANNVKINGFPSVFMCRYNIYESRI